MKLLSTTLLLFSLALSCLVQASDSYDTCTPGSSRKRIEKSSGYCIANNGKRYDFKNEKFIETFTDSQSGKQIRQECEIGYDALPAGLDCVTLKKN